MRSIVNRTKKSATTRPTTRNVTPMIPANVDFCSRVPGDDNTAWLLVSVVVLPFVRRRCREPAFAPAVGPRRRGLRMCRAGHRRRAGSCPVPGATLPDRPRARLGGGSSCRSPSLGRGWVLVRDRRRGSGRRARRKRRGGGRPRPRRRAAGPGRRGRALVADHGGVGEGAPTRDGGADERDAESAYIGDARHAFDTGAQRRDRSATG